MPEENAASKMRESFGKRADWNMTTIDFERWGRYFESMAQYAFMVRTQPNFDSIMKLFTIESILFMEWRGNIKDLQPDKFKSFDDMISKINAQLTQMMEMNRGREEEDEGYKIKLGLRDDLFELYGMLHDFKQSSGMGLPIRQEVSDQDRLRKALQ